MRSVNENLMQQKKLFIGADIKAEEAGISEKDLQLMQNLRIFDQELIFLILVFLEKTENSVSSSVGFALLVIDLKMVL